MSLVTRTDKPQHAARRTARLQPAASAPAADEKASSNLLEAADQPGHLRPVRLGGFDRETSDARPSEKPPQKVR